MFMDQLERVLWTRRTSSLSMINFGFFFVENLKSSSENIEKKKYTMNRCKQLNLLNLLNLY